MSIIASEIPDYVRSWTLCKGEANKSNYGFAPATSLDNSDVSVKILEIKVSIDNHAMSQSFVSINDASIKYGKETDEKNMKMSFGTMINKKFELMVIQLIKKYPAPENISWADKAKYSKKVIKTRIEHEYPIEFDNHKTLLLWMNQYGFKFFDNHIFKTGKHLNVSLYIPSDNSNNSPFHNMEINIVNLFWEFSFDGKQVISIIDSLIEKLNPYKIYSSSEKKLNKNNVEYLYFTYNWMPKGLPKPTPESIESLRLQTVELLTENNCENPMKIWEKIISNKIYPSSLLKDFLSKNDEDYSIRIELMRVSSIIGKQTIFAECYKNMENKYAYNDMIVMRYYDEEYEKDILSVKEFQKNNTRLILIK
jgi:hypothetical protein